MIKAEEIALFTRNKKAICKSFESCRKCPIAGGSRCCHTENFTQEQVDLIMAWEPLVDWSKVPVDAKVVVWDDPERKYRRYFAKYENGEIYTYLSGATSWSNESDKFVRWQYGRLEENG